MKSEEKLVRLYIHVVNKIFASFVVGEEWRSSRWYMDSVQSELLYFFAVVYFIAPPLFYDITDETETLS